MKRARDLIVAAAMTACLGLGLSLTIPTLEQTRPRWVDLPWPQGDMGWEIERLLSKDSAWAKPLQFSARWLAWHGLGDLGPDVRAGCPGWLFYAQEFVPPDWGALEHRLEAARAVQARLATLGIDLVLLPVPDKARVQAHQLCGLERHPDLAPRLARIHAGLQTRGLASVAPTWPGQPAEPLYYRADTHWNPAGSRLAAEALAAWLRQQHPDLARAPLIPQRLPVLEPAPADLLKLTRFDRMPGQASETQARWQFPQAPAAAASLLDEQALPVLLLVGTSYSRNAHFSEFLAAALGQSIATLAQEGAGFHTSMLAALGNPAMSKTPPRVVIWEFPERALTAPLTEAERQGVEQLTKVSHH